MKKMSVRKKLVIKLLILSAVSASITFFALIPNAKRVNALQLDIVTNQRDLEMQYIKSIYLKKSLEQFKQVAQMVKKYDKMTMKLGEELEVIRELEEVAESNNVRQDLQLRGDARTADPDTGLPFYTFNFRSHGSYEDLVAYFKDLELLPYYIIIDSLQWQRASGGGYNAEIGVNFDGKIYVGK